MLIIVLKHHPSNRNAASLASATTTRPFSTPLLHFSPLLHSAPFMFTSFQRYGRDTASNCYYSLSRSRFIFRIRFSRDRPAA